jgi:site-specific recombinase XerD
MPRIGDSINLSGKLKQISIPDLILMAKALIEGRGYSQSTIWHYNEKFNDLQRNSALYGIEKLSEEFITAYVEDGKHKSPRLTGSNVQRKLLMNLFASAVHRCPVFIYEKEADHVNFKPLCESLKIFEQHLREQGKSNDTIKSYLQTAAKFLLYLERTKVSSLQEVVANVIREFIVELGFKWSPRSMRIVPSHLKHYLSFMGVNTDAMIFSSLRTP